MKTNIITPNLYNKALSAMSQLDHIERRKYKNKEDRKVKVKVKVKLSLCFNEHHTMVYWGVEVGR
jgi:hypothetical protein